MDCLILVPTKTELQAADRILNEASERVGGAVEVLGFGPIAAAARSMQLILNHNPSRVVLVGIAGTYDATRFPVGSAMTFDEIHCWGVGVGMHQHTRSHEIGFDQVDAASAQAIGDRVVLKHSATESPAALITACAASRDLAKADEKVAAIPNALAEDMEGFGVAMSCQLNNVPLLIIRGASNRVGDREHAKWQIEKAMISASQLASQMLLEDKQ